MDVVVSHVNADFDSLGGLVGAARLYPGAAMVFPAGELEEVREFLSLHRDLLDVRAPASIRPEALTRIIVVDTARADRLGPAARWLEQPGVSVHVYDHHPPSDEDIAADLRRVEPWGSVSSLLALLLREREETLTPVEATAMLLGIYADTGSLSYAGTAPEDLEAAAWLLRQGAEREVVAEFTRRTLTPEQRRLLHALLSAVEHHDAGGARIALAVAPLGPHVEGAAGLVSRLLDLEEADAAVAIFPMDESLYVIARSASDSVDAGALLRSVGGGGHPRAASARLRDTDATEVRSRLLACLPSAVLREPRAEEIMSYPVRTVAPEATVAEAADAMLRYGHSGLVVLDEDRPVGVITRRDVDRARHHRLDHAPVRSFMSRSLHVAAPETPLSELERRMIDEGIGRLPVCRDGRVVGIITRTDVLRALYGARYLEGSERRGEPDAGRLLRERCPARVQSALEAVGRIAERDGSRAYLVGGVVRDLLLGEPNLDIDILVEPDGPALARAAARELGGEVRIHERFGTATLVLPDDFKLDFATARTEAYPRPGALPEVEASSLLDDLRRRDFTINAIALDLRPGRFGELVDPFGGRRDLEQRRLRILHNLSFVEDPTRIFRAVRFEERFRLKMEPQTEALAREAVGSGALSGISPERLRRELYATLLEPKALGALRRLEELGILRWLHPGLSGDSPVLRSLPAALDWWRRHAGDPIDTPLVYVAALAATAGAHAVPALAERLRLSPRETRIVETALRVLEERDALAEERDPAAVVRRLRDLPPEALALARSAAGERVRSLIERFALEWRHVKLEISGDDLKALGCAPGPALGRALRATLDEKLRGRLEGREAELAFARTLLDCEAAAGQCAPGDRSQPS